MEKSSFFLNSDIETLINNVESTVINELEGGNRQAGMKRLKVPPLSEKVFFYSFAFLSQNYFVILAKRWNNFLVGNVHGNFHCVSNRNNIINNWIKKPRKTQ